MGSKDEKDTKSGKGDTARFVVARKARRWCTELGSRSAIDYSSSFGCR